MLGRISIGALTAALGAAVLAVSGAATTSSSDPKTLVLRLGDLPSGFTVQASERVQKPDGVVRMLSGWEETYANTFHHSDGRGVLSAVERWESRGGADIGADVAKVEWREVMRGERRVSIGRIGIRTIALVGTMRSGGNQVPVVAVLWNRGRYVGHVLVFPAANQASPRIAEAVRYARIMDARIRRAA